MKLCRVILIFFIFMTEKLFAFGIDLYSTPTLISAAEMYLLAPTPETAFYQPAKFTEGISLSHSNPHGYWELNVFHLAGQFNLKNEQISAGSLVLENNNISDKVFYMGYSKSIQSISIGTNIRYYHQRVGDYDTLDAFTLNIGAIWLTKAISHGLSYSNVSHTTKNGLSLPVVFKYECMLLPIEKTNLALSIEKEKNFDLRYAFAVTHELTSIFSLNIGFISNPNQFSAGVIIKITDFDLSVGMRTHSQLGYTQAVGILYKL